MSKIMKCSLILILLSLNIIIYFNFLKWRDEANIINFIPAFKNEVCMTTENQNLILNCSQIADIDFFSKNFDFEFKEFNTNYLDNDYYIFLVNFKNKLYSCTTNCSIYTVQYFKAKIHCLTKSTNCDFQQNNLVHKNINIINDCTNNCSFKYFNNANYFLEKKLQFNCIQINGDSLFSNRELIDYFNKNKIAVCENIIINKKSNEIKLRNVGDSKDFLFTYPYNNGFLKFNVKVSNQWGDL